MLIAAALLRIPARRLRALALGDDGALREWIAGESALRLAEARRDARLVSERIASAGARLVPLGDAAYPAALLDLSDPPPFLVVRGTLPPGERGGSGTAIVGSRTPTPDAARRSYELALAATGPVVSGLALGIDAAAHRGALAAGTPTLAYVAHGAGQTYPPEHATLEEEIVAAGGAVASEVLPGSRVSSWSLVRRDRLQAAHARAVVLVQSEIDGGAMHTLRFAERLGRERYAFEPAAQGIAQDAGNRKAIADGARPLPGNVRAALAVLAASPS